MLPLVVFVFSVVEKSMIKKCIAMSSFFFQILILKQMTKWIYLFLAYFHDFYVSKSIKYYYFCNYPGGLLWYAGVEVYLQFLQKRNAEWLSYSILPKKRDAFEQLICCEEVSLMEYALFIEGKNFLIPSEYFCINGHCNN